MQKKQHIIVVAGPTASGKSDFAVELALKENGEIISADSRQIYRGLDIGTGKITKEEMKGVPHHMLDICDPSETFSVAEYKRLATPILLDILARGKTPIICGGTGQYIDALIFNTELPQVPPNHALRKELETRTTEELFEELEEKDEARASTIDRYNKVRLIRALEIVEALGVVPTQSSSSLSYKTTFYLMSPKRDTLRKRVQLRTEKRMSQGMLDEVRDVVKKYSSKEDLKRFGIEYDILSKVLDKTLREDEAKEMLINKSMQYAKRQETWNKKYDSLAIKIEVLK